MQIAPLDERVSLSTGDVLPQHRPIWLEILRGAGEDCRGLVAIDGQRILGWVLYTVREGAYGVVVNSMPLIAYGGPAVPDGKVEVAVALLEALRAEADYLGADVLSLGTSPFIPVSLEEQYRQALGCTHELENFVQIQDLEVHPLEALSSKRRDPIRRNIARATGHGLRVVKELSPKQLDEWLEIYRLRYAEIGATPYAESFHRLVYERAVPAGVAEFWGVLDGDRLVGGTIFLISSSVVDYFSTAYLSEYRDFYPNSSLLNEAFASFIERGVRYMNWESSPSRDGVYHYKARWGAREWRHFYMSVLLRPSSRLLGASIADVRREYPARFVLPFSAWTQTEGWVSK